MIFMTRVASRWRAACFGSVVLDITSIPVRQVLTLIEALAAVAPRTQNRER
ncbi:MAG: hypothetical protein JXB05_35645 [Myxococcaceae bacterium]|nr:hypothetical protein [Myxococcaceae bacterium]